jgi:succinoglycan biosynthesis transport protein ExoP
MSPKLLRMLKDIIRECLDQRATMSSNLASDYVQPSSPILAAAFASLWRRRWLAAAVAALVLAIGWSCSLFMPDRYTAEAYVKGEFFAAPDTLAKVDDSTTAGSMQQLDLGRVIESQSRLLQSHQLARRVVEQIGLERLQPIVSKRQILPATIFGSADKSPSDVVGVAATRLLKGLSVENYPRAYLLTVRYSASDPELAKLVANTFVGELLRSANVQMLLRQQSLAQAALSIQLAKFGNRHPSVAQARIRLATTDDLLKKEVTGTPQAMINNAGENVTKAISAAPASRSLVLLLVLLGSLVAGIGVALWLERENWYRH